MSSRHSRNERFFFCVCVPVRFSSQRFNSAESLATRCIHMFEVVSVTSTETSGTWRHMAALACNQSEACVCVYVCAHVHTHTHARSCILFRRLSHEGALRPTCLRDSLIARPAVHPSPEACELVSFTRPCAVMMEGGGALN